MNYKFLAIAALVSLANSACTLSPKPNLQSAKIDPQAIYEQNTGKRITQAKVLAQVAVGYGKLGQQDMAAKLLSPAIQTAKVNTAIRNQTEMWGEVGASYVKMGRYNDALQAAKALATQKYQDQGAAAGHVSIALDRMIRELVAAKQLDKATQVAQLISQTVTLGGGTTENPIINKVISKPRVLTRLADEYVKAGQREKALKVLALALQETKAHSYIVPELPPIAVAYAAAGQRNQALQLLAQATQINNPIDINYFNYFTEVAVAYDAIGQESQALQLLAQAKDKAKQKAEPASTNSLYANMTLIAVSYAEIGAYNQAFQIAKTIQPYEDLPKDASRTPDGLLNGSTFPDVFTQLAVRFAEAQQYNLALQAIQEIKWAGNKPAARAKLAVEYARAKQYDRAFQMLNKFKLTAYGAEPFTEAFTQVVDTVVKTERGDRIAQLLAQAIEVANTSDKLLFFESSKNIFALLAIASGYAEIGQREQAEPLLAQARQIAEQIRRDEEKAVALATIASGYAEIGQKEKAEQLLTQARQIGEGINR